MSDIKTLNLENNLKIDNRSVLGAGDIVSLDVEQTSGKTVMVEPVDGNLIIRPQSEFSVVNSAITLNDFGDHGTLNSPSDAKFDYIRKWIWIADTGNNRILRISSNRIENDKDADLEVANLLSYPHAIAVDVNQGGVFVKGYTDTDQSAGVVYHLNAAGVSLSRFEFSGTLESSSSSSSQDSSSSSSQSFSSSSSYLESSSSSSSGVDEVPAMPSPYSIVYDHVRSRVWWVSDSGVYMVDEQSKHVNTLDLKEENVIAGFIESAVSIDVEYESGNAFVVVLDNSGSSHIIQIFRDNNEIIATSQISPGATETLNVPIVNRSHHNLIPFTFMPEEGVATDLGSDAEIPFTISPYSEEFDYSAIINRDNVVLITNAISDVTTVYVPQDDDSYYHHRSEIYVDVIAKDTHGIKQIRTHVEPDAYDIEDATATYITPKFTWDNTLWRDSSITTTTTTLGFDGSFWVGSESWLLTRLGYNFTSSIKEQQKTLDSNVHEVIFSQTDGRAYVSTDSSLYVYLIEDYLDRNEVVQTFTTLNSGEDRISLVDGSNVWSVQSYSGNVLERDGENLSILNTYTGFDGPSKIVKSKYHGCYFVAGSHILWKLDGGISTPVYQIDGYTIVDFDIDDNGSICILFNGPSDEIIRVLDNDLYSLLINQVVTSGDLKYCVDTGKGIFYVLSEVDTGTSTYSFSNYVIDSNAKTLTQTDFEQEIVTTTTTSTLPSTTDAIAVLDPNGGETIKPGDTYEIKWATSKSATDLVKIELLRSGQIDRSIADVTVNDGSYSWLIPSDLIDGDDYSVQITWISASPESDRSDEDFTVDEDLVTTITTTTEVFKDSAIGIGHDEVNSRIIIVLRSGLFSIFDLVTSEVNGLIESGEISLSAIGMRNTKIRSLNNQTKVRVFVGSQIGWSDKWDSGEVSTKLTSMYYGGGNNLLKGHTYYVNIQTYSEIDGWGVVQNKEFTMPI